jgi:hypothetical protein
MIVLWFLALRDTSSKPLPSHIISLESFISVTCHQKKYRIERIPVKELNPDLPHDYYQNITEEKM